MFTNIVDPATGLPAAQVLWQQVALSLFGIAALVISIVAARIGSLLKEHLPGWLYAKKEADRALIDQKFKNDIHDAAMTAARDIILSGRDPRQAAKEGVAYMLESAKEATSRLLADKLNPRSLSDIKEIYEKILLSKSTFAALEMNNALSSMGQPISPEQLAELQTRMASATDQNG